MRAATSTAVLALAAVASAQNKTAVSQATFNDIVRYTGYAAASYADACGTPPNFASVVTYFSDAATDTQATLFRNDYSREIILAFRGTSSPVDANTDFAFGLAPLSLVGTSCPTCQVHGGFQNAYISVQTQVLAAVRAAQTSYPAYRFILTGHSLGGALASLATSSLVGSGVKVAAVYTYGEPRNGDIAFAAYIQRQFPPAQYFRVTHGNDGVPHIPPTFFGGYEHHGVEHWQSLNGLNNTAATTFACPASAGSGSNENPACNLATSYGDNAIDGAHISYSNQILGNALRITQCGEGQIY